jgi:hypothetical protein
MAEQAMSEAEARFAERLAEEVQAVLGMGLVIDSVSLAGEGPVAILATCLVDGQTRDLAVQGETLLDASRELIRAAAELRLAAAWSRLVTPV